MTPKDTPAQVQVGWIVEALKGTMFFALGEHAEAVTYCKDDAEPVAIYCDKEDLARQLLEGDKK